MPLSIKELDQITVALKMAESWTINDGEQINRNNVIALLAKFTDDVDFDYDGHLPKPSQPACRSDNRLRL